MSKRNFIRTMGAWIAVVFCLSPLAAVAAPDLDSAKAAGQVGERIDGYVGLVSGGAPDDVKAMVNEINAARKKSYAGIAAKNNLDVAIVAAQAGKKLLARAKVGEYINDGSGWKKKTE
jgi:uncharacterized protein YdbL (DUF1318 family)